MTDSLINACNALDALAQSLVDGWNSEQTLAETWGWNFPALTRHDFSGTVKKLSNRLRELSPSQVDNDLDAKLSLIPAKTEYFRNNTLPYLYNGHGQQAAPMYFILVNWISESIGPYLTPEVDWEDVSDNNLMPRALLRRLRSVDTQINTAVGRAGDLTEKIATIEDAAAIADRLPIDSSTLAEIRGEIEGYKTQSEVALAKTTQNDAKISELLKSIEIKQKEAVKLVEDCEDAYSAQTTKGLGSAFAERAKELKTSTWIWVLGLILALVAASWLGSVRVSALIEAMNNSDKQSPELMLRLILAFFAIAAPVWFAWIATKQIGQRFRLSEDYAYKASVAKAYEGYRREAVRLDADFAKRLFASTLSRIEEAPLRYVEGASHGSPIHEAMGRMFSSRSTDGSSKATQSPESGHPETGD